MDYLAYKHIFGYKQTDPEHGRFTQYYPHEHMDRYPIEPCARGKFSSKEARETRTPKGRGTGGPLSPHLYRYLVDDIQIAAGLLAEVDLYWAKRMFTANPAWSSDADLEWNEYLSKLGHALHAVEDYFVHSNFLELALKDWPGGAKYLPQKEKGPYSSWDIFQKRLKRFEGENEANENAEPLVVTGYFDFHDTFFSIRHVYEDAFGQEKGKGDPDAAEPWRKLLHNLVKAVQDALPPHAEITKEQARKRAEDILNKKLFDGELDLARTELNAEQEVKDAFLEAIAGLTERSKDAISLYDAWASVYLCVRALEAPLEQLKAILDKLNVPFQDLIKVPQAAIRQRIDARIGRFRVGCHSLMAKDYAWKDPNLVKLDDLYRQAKDLA
jgi:hypothetical protein